ncbi:hypothetical protein HETIRDRAFT_42700 [Heterobasidion irregulare TC 32-1]|uniref:Uncharacterized protein n=1 Tax=Heterobasidion irregulare (strain TC 32-1) TaxID=747525 RepID=W4KJL7_HETIT|nr:uncharacterized protein HETIRDRAFT_42700 [Heterobasidion irregulare TC 32-1]ETW85889.1 hypothetical protein HETIRDRAFT_42700 [Heterobasidion irregulare TC 32-1]
MIPPTPKKRLSGIGVASSHGRLYKVLGDFFLLAGRTEDASIWFAKSSIALFKLPSDTVWHASALEGLAVLSVLDAWSSGQGLQASFSNSREPWSDISERLSQAITLYSKAVPSSSSDAEQRLDILAYLYSTAVLRQTSLFFATWSAKGWGPLAFTAMLHPGPLPYIPPTLAYAEYNTPANRDRLSSISGITASHISVILAQAHGPWLLHMGHRERIIILEEIASMYSSLGYHRKEAYILREVIGCVMDLMVCGREEAGDIGLGYALANAASMMQDKGAVGVKENERPDGNESVLKLVKHVCNVHGVNLSVVKLIDTGSITSDGPLETEASQNEDPEEVILEDPYGWPELQVGIVREALAVAEALPDSPAAAQFALSALKSLHAVLSEEDQYHFYYTSARALTTARRRGDKRVIDYWSGRPVDSIEILPLPPVKLLVENPMSILSPRQSHGVSILTGMTDPFLYNPRRAFASQGQTLVVKNEILELRLTLRNPYVFNLEIEALALSTSGVPFESKPISVVIPANSFHSITMSGKPLDTGILTIRGCFVQAPGGASHEFVLPLSTLEEEDKKSRRRSTIACESGRSKYHGLESRPWEKAGKRLSIQKKGTKASTELRRFLDCKVVPEQPLLRIRWSSLTHGAVMLYDGETSTIRLTLENVSSLPIDFLRLTFDDSTIPPAQQALVDGELSVFDTYETEYELISRPVFSWSSDLQQTKIPPHRKVTIVITCLGKVGCTSGAIHVAYGYVHRKQDTLQKPSDVFHTRRLSYPVLVTVYHMLECHRMDILPFRPQAVFNSNDDQGDNNSDTARKKLLCVDEDSWCLFSIDVRNTYGLPFEVTFDRIQEGSLHASTTCLVAPGSTSRIVLPLKKFLLPDDIASQPIPTLSDRQFVVAKSNLTSGEEVAQRELFWYREELFKCVRGRWREAGGTRSGELSLRQQRMSLPMLENLRTESARVSMCLVCRDNALDDPWQTVDQKDSKFLPKAYDFVYLQIKVTNLSLSPLVLTVDVLADPSDHVIQEGVMLDIPLGNLDSGESREIETALCFVSCGRFEITAEVRVMGLSRDEGKVGTGLLTAIVRDE